MIFHEDLMRIAIFSQDGEKGLGLVKGEKIAVIEKGDGIEGRLVSLIGGDDGARRAAEEQAALAETVGLGEVTLEPPVASRRAAVICVGKNYHAHAKEFFGSGFDSSAKEEVPSQPVVFAKAGSSLVGDNAPIVASLDETGTVDYEGELAVVIGKPAHKVSRADAMEHVFGYTICNDVTSRELQKRHNQWLIGKSLDSFGPLGPFIVTRDELPDITAQELETKVNGEVRQKAPIADLIFDIPFLIETLSRTMTLQPGDIIATGTPAGVGIGFTPPKYLKSGDVVEVSISGIGTLTNAVA
jgi:2-keto-4-pentenoate hydratase/2-oxohepta-3-ene-1,7-dioic acid hydratase in catechol pathway